MDDLSVGLMIRVVCLECARRETHPQGLAGCTHAAPSPVPPPVCARSSRGGADAGGPGGEIQRCRCCLSGPGVIRRSCKGLLTRAAALIRN
jgi:hypothetical protein